MHVQIKITPPEWYQRLVNKFTGKSKKTSKVMSHVRMVLRGVADTLDGVPAPGLKGAIKGVLFILDNVDRASQNLEDFKAFGDCLASYESLFESYKSPNLPPALKEAIATLTKEIEESCQVIERIVAHCRTRRIWESTDDAGLFTKQVRVINNALSRFQIATASFTSVTISGSLEISQRLHVDRLPNVQGVAFNSAVRDKVAVTCMESTRVQVRKRINDWIFDENGPPVFWLRGTIGSGKSTILQTIAEECHEQGYLAGSFFFSRDLLSPHAGSSLFSTLALQLCDFDNRLIPILSEILGLNPKLTCAAIEEHYAELITRPLAALEAKIPAFLFPMVVVIDALDECHNPKDIATILSLLFNYPLMHNGRPILKFLLSSRQELYIRQAFERIPEPREKVYCEHNLDEEADVQSDIEAYLKQGLDQVYQDHPECFRSRQAPWPGTEALATLVERSGGSFIQASAILHYVSDIRQYPPKQLRDILDTTPDNPNTGEVFSGVDRMYKQTLSRDPNVDRVCAIVGTIILSPEPVSENDLQNLLNLIDGEAHVTLQWLQSILTIPASDTEPIHVVHRSLRDFMTTKARAGEYYVDPNEDCTILRKRWLDNLACMKAKYGVV
ncbi:hypothetical protein BDN71DRAFT_921778 [Pleurotus eryngii]|uniref:Nephrocystin 3-like N-terminal domain-containing protein n=1 Tax=Pleurotus eryngii TaxID=5323 RepID=A0A9P5ZVZ7_PLEER|nr:hypothetical protein BDN71DRAFT_921778 [Pleurotus eryngii]